MGSAKNQLDILNATHSSYFIPPCKEKDLKSHKQQNKIKADTCAHKQTVYQRKHQEIY
jgi:hypothetical protein